MPQGQSLDSSAFPGSLNSQNNLAQDKSFATSFAVAQRSIGGRECSVVIQKKPHRHPAIIFNCGVPK
jgi:hypothetical protein